jgi:DUF1707 SHOCT-like domain
MTAGPGDDEAADDKAAAGSHGHMRASGADRERVIDTLKAAFVEERLTKDELDVRVGHAYSSQTYAELAAITADLPAGSAAAPPAGQPAGTLSERPPLGPAKKAVLMGTALTFQPALLVIGILLDNGPLVSLVGISMSAYFIFLTVAVLGMIGQRLERSAGQPPPPVKPGQLPEGDHGDNGDQGRRDGTGGDPVMTQAHPRQGPGRTIRRARRSPAAAPA